MTILLRNYNILNHLCVKFQCSAIKSVHITNTSKKISKPIFLLVKVSPIKPKSMADSSYNTLFNTEFSDFAAVRISS